jgi:hypothetical protein
MVTRKYVIARLAYLLVVLVGALVLYLLIPREVWQTIRDTYFSTHSDAVP